jgi:hypothetical protein
LAEGFPNLLMVLGPHTARGNLPRAVEHSVERQTGLLRFMREHGYTRVESRPEHVEAWTQAVAAAAQRLLSWKVDSWRNGMNQSIDGHATRRVLGFNGNGKQYRAKTKEVADNGYHGFAFR